MIKSSEKMRREAAESPVAWFVVLERATRDGNFELAAKALRQLKRLGVIVKYSCRPRKVSHD